MEFITIDRADAHGPIKFEPRKGEWRRMRIALRAILRNFAVELLLAGVPLERVSILLGHSSVKITEEHYNPWVRSRQEQLEADQERALALDPVALSETAGTRKHASF